MPDGVERQCYRASPYIRCKKCRFDDAPQRDATSSESISPLTYQFAQRYGGPIGTT